MKRIIISILRILTVGLTYWAVGTFVCYFVILKHSFVPSVEAWNISLKAGCVGGLVLALFACVQEIKELFDFYKNNIKPTQPAKRTGQRKGGSSNLKITSHFLLF
ncbi:MAG: hypothetical protein QXI58_01490 [Candidatus Micrarchaeia archaeon]